MNANIIAIPAQIVPLVKTRAAPATNDAKCEMSRFPASFIPLLRIVFPTDPSTTSRKSNTYVLVLWVCTEVIAGATLCGAGILPAVVRTWKEKIAGETPALQDPV
jgi:hypothetical protein